MLVLPERAKVTLAYGAQFELVPKVHVCTFRAFLDWKAVLRPYTAQADGSTPDWGQMTYSPSKERFDWNVIWLCL